MDDRTGGNPKGDFARALRDLARLAESCAEPLEPAVEEAGDRIWSCLRAGGKVLACGNGGSAADAQHFVAELVGRMGPERGPLAGLALTVDTSVLTAVSNDYGYETVFERQVRALGAKGDVLVALSTSGRSPNVILAARAARERGMAVVALCGSDEGTPLAASEVFVTVPSPDPQRVQELHTAVLHGICRHVDRLALEARASKG
jgi:D-sedoheptulose 7-phosphate isomerase